MFAHESLGAPIKIQLRPEGIGECLNPVSEIVLEETRAFSNLRPLLRGGQLREALMRQSSPEHEPGTVITVFERGYSISGRLVRAARTVVAGE